MVRDKEISTKKEREGNKLLFLRYENSIKLVPLQRTTAIVISDYHSFTSLMYKSKVGVKYGLDFE